MSEHVGKSSSSEPHDRGHLLALDGVRGLAILIVVIHNAAWVAGTSQQLLLKLAIAVTATGWIGVQLFFVLSGFLITGILLDSRGRERYFRTFYLRRTLRIFPLYYAFLVLALVIGPLFSTSPGWIASVHRSQWWYWLYMSNWMEPFKGGVHGLSHLWSLAVEEQFYLLWPLAVAALGRRRFAYFCVALMVITPPLRYVMHLAGLPPTAAYDFTIARWDALAMGGLVAVLIRDEQGVAWLARWRRWITGAALVSLGGLVLQQHGFHGHDVPVQVFGQSIIGILSSMLICYAITPAPGRGARVGDLLESRPLRFLGKYSYAMYVSHFPIHQALWHWIGDEVRGADTPSRLLRLGAYVATVLGLSIFSAMLSWRFLEQPILRLKNRIAPRVINEPGMSRGSASEALSAPARG
jgi:peptidoglycan/LPS O-acetylase OafA/YrhL